MESYKHSCPSCGQHIEYTAGYCGKQIQCPICGNTVTFPAIPPNRSGNPIRTVLPTSRPSKPRRSLNPWPWLTALQEYPHWKMIFACLVPFVIIGLLLLGASALKKHAGDEPAKPAPVAAVDRNAYQKMADLARAEEVVQQQLNAVLQTRAAALSMEQTANQVRNRPHSPSDQIRAAEANAAAAERVLNARRQAFQAACDNYQRLGGTIDYRSRMPN